MSEKILIIGKGFLGNAIFNTALKNKFQCITTKYSSEEKIDICNYDLIEKFITKTKPDYIINCAGLTNTDKIESDSTKAYEVNAYGVKNLALIANKKNILLVHISTDSVFDGNSKWYNEEKEPNPINEYAKTKKLGEDFVGNIASNSIIIRTNFYGYNNQGKFLFNWVLNNLELKKSFMGFTDVIFNPLEINNLSQMVLELMKSKFVGIIHLSSNEALSKFQFAITIAEELGFNIDLIKKGKLKDSNLIAKRPLNTTLSNKKATSLLQTRSISLKNWLKNEFNDYYTNRHKYFNVSK